MSGTGCRQGKLSVKPDNRPSSNGDEDDYLYWKANMKIYIEFRYIDMWDIIETRSCVPKFITADGT